MKRLCIVSVFLASMAVSAFAETTIKAEVDKKLLATDESLIYKLNIISSEGKISSPQFPKFEGFVVLSQVQSSSINIVAGQLKTMITYVFVLVPKEKGRFTIGPAKIQAGGATYTSENFEIEVKAGKNKITIIPDKRRPPTRETIPFSKEPQTTL